MGIMEGEMRKKNKDKNKNCVSSSFWGCAGVVDVEVNSTHCRRADM